MQKIPEEVQIGKIPKQNQLLKQKDYILNLFDNAIEEQSQNRNIQHNITFHSDDLKLTIEFIKELWSQYIQSQDGLNNNSLMQDEYNSITNSENNYQPYSSIILQHDNQNLSALEIQQLEQNSEINSQQDSIFNDKQSTFQDLEGEKQNEFQAVNQQDQYIRAILEEKKDQINNVISETDMKIKWLTNLIQKNSSLISNKQIGQSKVSDEGYNIVSEQIKEENQLNNGEMQNSFALDGTIKKTITIEELISFQALLRVTNKFMKEDTAIHTELIELQTEIIKLKQKISDQYAEIFNIQKFQKVQRYEERLTQKFLKKKQKDGTQKAREDILFLQLEKACNQVMNKLQITPENPKNKQNENEQIASQVKQKCLDKHSISQMMDYLKSILQQAKLLKNHACECSVSKEKALDLVEDYRSFILIVVLDQEFFPKETIELTSDIIN